MFTNENHEDDSSLSVNLTNNNQIHETSVSEMPHQLHDDSIPFSNTIYDEEQSTLAKFLPKIPVKGKIKFHALYYYIPQSQSTLFFQNTMNNEEVDEVSDIENDIYSENGPWSIERKIIIPT